MGLNTAPDIYPTAVVRDLCGVQPAARDRVPQVSCAAFVVASFPVVATPKALEPQSSGEVAWSRTCEAALKRNAARRFQRLRILTDRWARTAAFCVDVESRTSARYGKIAPGTGLRILRSIRVSLDRACTLRFDRRTRQDVACAGGYDVRTSSQSDLRIRRAGTCVRFRASRCAGNRSPYHDRRAKNMISAIHIDVGVVNQLCRPGSARPSWRSRRA